MNLMRIPVVGAAGVGILLAVGAAVPAMAASLSGGYNLGAVNFTCNASGQGSGFIDQGTAGCVEYIVSGSFMASGSGQASYDTVRATARIGATDLDPSTSIGSTSLIGRATAQAQYTDTVTIDIAGRTGEVVDLVFETELNGTMSAIADYTYVYAQAQASLLTRVNGYNVNVSRNAKSSGTPASNDFNPGRVQITLGTPFSVSTQLQVEALLQRTGGSTQYFTGDAVADFFNSGGITSFQLFEPGEGGALIQNWNLSSESGQFGFYNAVPGPATAWLLATGLAALGRFAHRRRRG